MVRRYIVNKFSKASNKQKIKAARQVQRHQSLPSLTHGISMCSDVDPENRTYQRKVAATAQKYWLEGDWTRLSTIDIKSITDRDARCRIAALRAATSIQEGNNKDAKEFLQLARKAGATKKAIGRVLLSGIHFSLSRSWRLAGNPKRATSQKWHAIEAVSPGLAEVVRSQQLSLADCSSNLRSITDTRHPSLEEMYLEKRGKVSDKWYSYLDLYNELFGQLRKRSINLLEIGVQNGGSLEVWADYFPNARTIVGCDIDPKCKRLEFEDSRISVTIGDICEAGTQKELMARLGSDPSIIIDDGSHKSPDIIAAFCALFSRLEWGGIYVIEDLHCSYWSRFSGGLERVDTAMEFFKFLCDVINVEHWETSTSKPDPCTIIKQRFGLNISEDILLSIKSIHFTNSVVWVLKERIHRTQLGRRIFRGSTAPVTGE